MRSSLLPLGGYIKGTRNHRLGKGKIFLGFLGGYVVYQEKIVFSFKYWEGNLNKENGTFKNYV